MINSGLKKLRERGDHSLANEIAQALQEWDDGLTSRGSTFAEGYFNGRLGFQVHILCRVNGQSSPPHGYCIQFQLPTLDYHVGEVIEVFGIVFNHCYTIPAAIHGARSASGERSMFINSVEVVKLPKWVSGEGAAPLERLERFDNSPGFRCNATNLAFFHFGEFMSIFKDREFGTLDFPVVHSRAVFHCQGEGQMVQGRAQIENAISNQNPEFIGDTTRTADPESAGKAAVAEWLRRGVRVWFVDDFVGLSVDPLLDLEFEAIEMLACPINL